MRRFHTAVTDDGDCSIKYVHRTHMSKIKRKGESAPVAPESVRRMPCA